jgi:uncharacterized tellurite resistance protein B-like protein
MGLFSNLRGKGAEKSLDVSTAVMVPIVSAMLADGQIDDDEVVQIRSLCAWSPIYARNSRDEDTDIILRAIRLVQDEGAGEMCRKAGAFLSPGLKETAFLFAVRVVFADGHVGAAEQQLIESLAGWLGVQEMRAGMLVEAVSIMQHPADA